MLIFRQIFHPDEILSQADASVVGSDRDIVIRLEFRFSQHGEGALHQDLVLKHAAGQHYRVDVFLFSDPLADRQDHIGNSVMKAQGDPAFAYSGRQRLLRPAENRIGGQAERQLLISSDFHACFGF
jgi:hypothetical protein